MQKRNYGKSYMQQASAKQSQFGRVRQGSGGRLYKQSQSAEPGGERPGRRADCAKQSQFRFFRTWLAAKAGQNRQEEKRRGGSGCGNGGTFPRTGSRGIGRVGPSGSKITRARNTKRPGTSGGGRNPEGEALPRPPSVGKGPQTRGIAFGKGSQVRNVALGDPNPIRLVVHHI